MGTKRSAAVAACVVALVRAKGRAVSASLTDWLVGVGGTFGAWTAQPWMPGETSRVSPGYNEPPDGYLAEACVDGSVCAA